MILFTKISFPNTIFLSYNLFGSHKILISSTKPEIFKYPKEEFVRLKLKRDTLSRFLV